MLVPCQRQRNRQACIADSSSFAMLGRVIRRPKLGESMAHSRLGFEVTTLLLPTDQARGGCARAAACLGLCSATAVKHCLPLLL